MAKYRKKPVEIEAVPLLWSTWEEVCDFVKAEGFRGITQSEAREMFPNKADELVDGRVYAVIPTIEGNHLATEGDMIIKGVKGEFYPCKPDIFLNTYERVAADAYMPPS